MFYVGIFSFQPPINILALLALWPARFLMDAHKYHRLIVFCARLSNLPLLLIIRVVERYILFVDPSDRHLWRDLKPDYFKSSVTDLDTVFEHEDDIDDDSLPGGAFQVHDGDTTPELEREHDSLHQLHHRKQAVSTLGKERERGKELDQKRRTLSMSEYAQSTIKAKPTILSRLYGPGRRDTWNIIDEEQEALKDRLERIEQGQKRIEEALRNLGSGDGD